MKRIFAALSMLASPMMGQASLPRPSNYILTNFNKFQAFVTTFLETDAQARTLLSPSNLAIYRAGFRPVIGVPNNPDTKFGQTLDLKKYFTRKAFLDIETTTSSEKEGFVHLLDSIGADSDKTLLLAGRIVQKYDLAVEGGFDFRREFSKVTDPHDLHTLKLNWLNDAILGTEMRLLAWIYQNQYHEPYVVPEKRR